MILPIVIGLITVSFVLYGYRSILKVSYPENILNIEMLSFLI